MDQTCKDSKKQGNVYVLVFLVVFRECVWVFFSANNPVYYLRV